MQTCDQAQKNDLKYAWVDTCCINKESSAELSEAINSMWRYYENADVCYAFLSDVGSYSPELTEAIDRWWTSASESAYHKYIFGSPHRSEGLLMVDEMLIHDPREPQWLCLAAQEFWHEKVAKSRWSVRGWTLQELIAPEHVVFFDSAWSILGVKRCLSNSLRSITGIDRRVIVNPAWLSDPAHTIAKKMSWAAGRKTSYKEDRAYSLLGLFDIRMPLLYGEGEKAFIRLQEEIIKNSTDLSFLVHQPKTSKNGTELILAESPDQFHVGAKVVPWHAKTVDTDFRLTNRGLEFRRLSTITLMDTTFALLNCRLEDDMRGPLALRLCRADSPTTVQDRWSFLELPSPNAANDYWIANGKMNPFQAQHSIMHTEVIVFPMTKDAERDDRPATILTKHPSTFVPPLLCHSQSFNSFSKLWLRVEEESTQKIRILDAVPPEAWNSRTDVLLAQNLPFIESGTCCAGVRVEMLGLDRHVVDIGFRYNHPQDIVDFSAFSSIRRDVDRPRVLAAETSVAPIDFTLSCHADDRDLFAWTITTSKRATGPRFQRTWKGSGLSIESKEEVVLEGKINVITIKGSIISEEDSKWRFFES
ncbi:unnamed protein product [Cercospora beticola]|nr:unnamed protein product [Cercospora beticola]